MKNSAPKEYVKIIQGEKSSQKASRWPTTVLTICGTIQKCASFCYPMRPWERI